MWQQNANIFTDDGTATINTEAGKNAVTAITQLFDAGLANPQLNYADSQQAFLNGEAAILVNGTWVVDFYTAEAAKAEVGLNNYYVADFPTLFETGATWADSHMWAIPSSLEGDEQRLAALKVLAFINDHNIDWARTGHMAVRKSVRGKRCLHSAAAPRRIHRHRGHRQGHAAVRALRRDPGRAEPRASGDLADRQVRRGRAGRCRARSSGPAGPLSRPRAPPAHRRGASTIHANRRTSRWTAGPKQTPRTGGQARPWVCGFNFLPSTAVNFIEMWHADTFDMPTIERELGWAAEIGFNAIRVNLPFLGWEHDRDGLIDRLDRLMGGRRRPGHRHGALPVRRLRLWRRRAGLGAAARPGAGRPQQPRRGVARARSGARPRTAPDLSRPMSAT